VAFIRKLARTSNRKVRWEVFWDVYDSAGKRRKQSRTFKTNREAKTQLAVVLIARPQSTAGFESLTDHFLTYYQKLVEIGERERSTFAQLRQHIKLHILTDAEFAKLTCNLIGTPEVQMFLDRLMSRVSPKMATKVRTTMSQMFAARDGVSLLQIRLCVRR
jgi:hypothetical protein